MTTDLERLRIELARCQFLAACLPDAHAIVREDVAAWLDSCVWACEIEQRRTRDRTVEQ